MWKIGHAHSDSVESFVSQSIAKTMSEGFEHLLHRHSPVAAWMTIFSQLVY